MAALSDIVSKIRSKNAGPFWLTVDIFCGTQDVFDRVSRELATRTVADAFNVNPAVVKRFDIETLRVVKFSLPRPDVQGTLSDRDMHGASFANLLTDVEV